MFCWFYVFGFLMAVVAIVFGAVGISKADAGALNRGRAVAGLVLGIIGLLLFAVVVFFVLRAIGDNEGTEIGMVFLAIP